MLAGARHSGAEQTPRKQGPTQQTHGKKKGTSRALRTGPVAAVASQRRADNLVADDHLRATAYRDADETPTLPAAPPAGLGALRAYGVTAAMRAAELAAAAAAGDKAAEPACRRPNAPPGDAELMPMSGDRLLAERSMSP